MAEAPITLDDHVPVGPGASDEEPPAGPEAQESERGSLLVNTGWFLTGVSIQTFELPFRVLLKDVLHLTASQSATFQLLMNIPIYIKPLAGILSDAVPLFGTRRRSYLLISLAAGALLYLLMGFIPRTFGSLLTTYLILNISLTMTSTVFGGLMVEIGKRYGTTGKLSAQRLGIVRMVDIIAKPLGGFLATRPFVLPSVFAAALQFLLIPIIYRWLREPQVATVDRSALRDLRRQAVVLFSSRTLWAAAGLVILVVAAPGFNTTLLYYQLDHLKFSTQFIGYLGVVTALCGMLGAAIYALMCRRMNLRTLLAVSIVLHASLTLFYLLYGKPGIFPALTLSLFGQSFHLPDTHVSAIVITGIEAATLVLALLPLYDLAARATPRGSEALGYSLMMSVWNFTNALADQAGAWVYNTTNYNFGALVWVNAGMTALVLVAVPFLPGVLMDRREGQRE